MSERLSVPYRVKFIIDQMQIPVELGWNYATSTTNCIKPLHHPCVTEKQEDQMTSGEMADGESVKSNEEVAKKRWMVQMIAISGCLLSRVAGMMMTGKKDGSCHRESTH